VGKVGDVVQCVGGSTPSTTEKSFWENGNYNWATPKDLSHLSNSFLLTTDRKITQQGLAKISSGLLPVGTLLMSSRAPVGYLALATIPVAINQGFIGILSNEYFHSTYMLNWCQFNMSEITNRATGTTFAEISKSSFREISLIIPPQLAILEFTKSIDNIYQQVVSNLQQIDTLTTLRDTLLPKLLSGEAEVFGFNDLEIDNDAN
jgi:type I restriction enzyme S subunit